MNGDPWGQIEHICCTFDVKVFNIILGLFNPLLLKYHVTLKQLAVERNRLKSGAHVLFVVLVYLWDSILGHPVHLLGTVWY